MVRNVTDIDDKIIAKAAEAGRPWWAHAALYEQAFRDGYQILGCLPPTVEPRATGHVPEMITLMQRLIDAGHAYPVAGDVYFDVRSFPDYGALSGQRIEEMLPAGDSVGDGRKRDPRDFALWKAAKPGEPSWPTPWGDGRPGWHLECSAMAGKYLGAAFDIHGGGLDLIFPHHENELAQSAPPATASRGTGCTTAGSPWPARRCRSRWATPSRSAPWPSQWRPVELRYYLGAAHYRSGIEYSPEALQEASVAYAKIENFVQRAVELVGEPEREAGRRSGGVRQGDGRRPGRAAGAGGRAQHPPGRQHRPGRGDKAGGGRRAGPVLAMTGALGLNPLDWQAAGDTGRQATLTSTVDRLVRLALQQRQDARARKDYAAGDAIRDALAEAGVLVEDTPGRPALDAGSDVPSRKR